MHASTRRRNYGFERIPVHCTLFHAPGCSASRLHWAWASHQVVPVLVLLLGRGEALHPCSFLPTTAALDNAHPPAQQPRKRRENRKKTKNQLDEKTNLTTPWRPLPSAPVLFSSCRASPVSYFIFGYSLHRRSPTSHRSTVAC